MRNEQLETYFVLGSPAALSQGVSLDQLSYRPLQGTKHFAFALRSG